MVPSAISSNAPVANGQWSKLGYPPYICSILVRNTCALSAKVQSVPGWPSCNCGNFQIYSHHHGKPSTAAAAVAVAVAAFSFVDVEDVVDVEVVSVVSFTSS